MSLVVSATDRAWLAAEVAPLFRVAYRLTGNAHDAEDLVQDVCERALRAAPEFSSAVDCRRWLVRVLYNRFVDDSRHRQRSPFVAVTRDALAAAAGEASAEPEADALAAQSEVALLDAWERLDPGQQLVLLLRAEGYGLAEIARIVDVDKAALSSRLYRARASLARYLKEAGATPSGSAPTEKAR